MLLVASSLQDFAIAANDGAIGTVSDFLFDDQRWTVRWMVADAGSWLTGRKVLIHPSAIAPADYTLERLPVRLTKQQVQDSPAVGTDLPVSQQVQDSLYSYYDWDPLWGGASYLGSYGGGLGGPFGPIHSYNEGGLLDMAAAPHLDDGDPHLRSMSAVKGYHIHAADGTIGHVENFMVDTDSWSIRYLIVNTGNWWPGRHVLISPYAVRDINWLEPRSPPQRLTRPGQGSPPWAPVEAVDRDYEQRLHSYYGWRGYGW